MVDVDVVIPVHSVTRPIKRAVASVLEHNSAQIRVIVVVHNLAQNLIEANLEEYATDARVKIFALSDGIFSPAGPMNLGFSMSDAPFVSLLGSDDTFAAGAIDSLLKKQKETKSDFVIAPIRMVDGRIDPYPPVRRGTRTIKLDPVKDRLIYRSAPLGLICSKQISSLSFPDNISSGEDLPFTLSLLFQSRKIAYDLDGPAYVGGRAVDRVTHQPRDIFEDFRFLDIITQSDWFINLAISKKRAIVLKILRIHLFDAIASRISSQIELDKNHEDFLNIYTKILKLAPSAEKYLSQADSKVFNSLKNEKLDLIELNELLASRWKYKSLPTLITTNPLLSLSRQSPFRTLSAGFRITNRFPAVVSP